MLAKVAALLLVAFVVAEAVVYKTTLGSRETYREKLIKAQKWDEFRILRRVKQGMYRHFGQRLGVSL